MSQGIKKAKAHGIGVHSQEEIMEFGKTDLGVLSGLLGDKPFFFGAEPSLVSLVPFYFRLALCASIIIIQVGTIVTEARLAMYRYQVTVVCGNGTQ